MNNGEPTSEASRLVVLDALRGFALFGICLMNLTAFSGWLFMRPTDTASLPTAEVDGPALFVIQLFARGKFYSLFSLLFGIGFALQLDAAARRGDPELRVFKRRLLGLFAIGIVHSYFWEGDILAFYALVAVLLVPLRRLSQRALITLAAVLLVAPVALDVLIVASAGELAPGRPLQRMGVDVLAHLGFGPGAMPFPVLRDAGWSEYLRFQLASVFFRWADLLDSGRAFKVLATFLIGLWVGRSGMLRDLALWTPTLRTVRAWGLGAGLLASTLQAILMSQHPPVNSWLRVVDGAMYALGVVPLALGYAATFALLWQAPGWQGVLARLAPAGRMALTCYLSQTVIALATFTGLGLGLMGSVGPIWWPLYTAAVVLAQIIASRWWMRAHAFGPVEWVWRQLTYGRRLSNRRAIGSAREPGVRTPG